MIVRDGLIEQRDVIKFEITVAENRADVVRHMALDMVDLDGMIIIIADDRHIEIAGQGKDPDALFIGAGFFRLQNFSRK